MTDFKADAKSINHHIFNQTYLYAIPGYYRYSREYTQRVGHLSTGDKELDRAYMTEYVNVGGTIADIIRLYEQGADIRFQNQQDLVRIYEVLVTHLNNWAGYLDRDPNVKDAPIQSLTLMGDFANSIRPIVLGYKPKAEEVPKLKAISSLFGAGAELLFNPSPVGIEVQEPVPVVSRIEKLLADRHKKK